MGNVVFHTRLPRTGAAGPAARARTAAPTATAALHMAGGKFPFLDLFDIEVRMQWKLTYYDIQWPISGVLQELPTRMG